MTQGRNQKGQFSSKGEEFREVRSLRLTNSAWEKLGKMAEERGITRADLIEDWILLEGSSPNLINVNEVIDILTKALTLKANAGGAIKDQIKIALKLL